MKITQTMIEASYKYGVAYAQDKVSAEKAVEEIVNISGMNASSAQNAITNLKNILNGKKYHWTMSANETIWKFDQIKKDFGDAVYHQALSALELHGKTRGLQPRLETSLASNKWS